MSLIYEELLREEKRISKASAIYRKIKLLESGIFQRTLRFVFLYNIIIIVIIIIIQSGGEKLFLFKDKIYFLFGEIILINLSMVFFGKSERRFNKLLKSGIVLKTTIVQNMSWVMKWGENPAFRIYSYYVCEDGTKLVFEQAKNYYPYNKIFYINTTYGLEKKLCEEEYITVIVNPEKCKEYEILVNEIGVPNKEKYDVPYAKKSVNSVLLILLALEYLAFLFLL